MTVINMKYAVLTAHDVFLNNDVQIAMTGCRIWEVVTIYLHILTNKHTQMLLI